MGLTNKGPVLSSQAYNTQYGAEGASDAHTFNAAAE